MVRCGLAHECSESSRVLRRVPAQLKTMGKYVSIALLLLLCFRSLEARSTTDIVVMKNGDRLTCEIKKLEGGILYASLDYVDGTVEISWTEVQRLESSQLFVVIAEDGRTYSG